MDQVAFSEAKGQGFLGVRVFFLFVSFWAAITPALVFFILSPFSSMFFGKYASQRLFLSFLIGGLVVYSGVIVAFWGKLKKSSFLFLVCLVCLFFECVFLPFSKESCFWSEPGMYAFFILAMALTAAALTGIRLSDSYVRLWVTAIALLCFLYGAMSVNIYLFALSDGVTKMSDYIPWGFVNIRYWSHLATWLLPLLPLAVLVGPLKEQRLWRWGVTLGAGLWWWIVFLSTARGSMAGIASGTVIAAVIFGRNSLPWLRVLGVHLLTGAVIWLLLTVIIPSFFVGEVQLRPIKLDSSGRWPLFVEAWRMSLENFPFGMGPQSWLTHEILTEEYAASRKFAHPHNMYLMWAAEYGWLLIAVMALVCVQALRYLWRARNRAAAAADSHRLLLLTGFTASVAAAMTHAGVSAVFMAPASMLIGLFVLIGFWALILPEPDKSGGAVPGERPRKFRTALYLALIMVLAVAWMAWVREVWIYYQDMREDEKTYYEEGEGGIMPRFWLHGNFPR